MMGDHYYDPDPHHPHSNLCQEWQLLCLAQCPTWRGKQLPSTITDPVIYLSINLSVSSVHHKTGRNEGGWRDLVWIEGIEWILFNAVRTYISLMCVCVCMGGWLCYRWLMLVTHSTMLFSVLCVCLQPGRWIIINDTGTKTASRQTKEKRRGTKDGQTAQEGRTMMGDVCWWLHCPQPSARSSPFNFPTTNRRGTKWPICIAYPSDGSIYIKHIQLCFQALVQEHLQKMQKWKQIPKVTENIFKLGWQCKNPLMADDWKNCWFRKRLL